MTRWPRRCPTTANMSAMDMDMNLTNAMDDGGYMPEEGFGNMSTPNAM